MNLILRASVILIVASSLGCSNDTETPGFVTIEDMHFIKDGKPYYFLGTNMWYGANLGMEENGGDRERLTRELDLLKEAGISNLRVLGASEGNTQHNTVSPAIQTEQGVYDEEVLKGLDFLLAEMAERDMLAVIFLNNYWVWSGGMAQYISWFEGEAVPNPFLEQYTWHQFMNFSSRFYTHENANQAYRSYIKKLLNRKNSITGIRYNEDPVIMAWQLANEPRPGQGDEGKANFEVFSKWVGETARFIKSVDPNHLISTGNEGTAGCIGSAGLYKDIHLQEDIDYVTVHLWVLNWGWLDPLNADETYPQAETKALAYIDEHIGYAEEIGKPLVLEEFGIPRDGHSYSPQASTTWRDRYFDAVYGHIHANAVTGGPLTGSNFWAWGGFGKTRDMEHAAWKKGDPFTGDPPQEPQGRNSVFTTDSTTIAILKNWAGKMNSIMQD